MNIDLKKIYDDNYLNFMDIFEVDMKQYIKEAEQFLKSYIALDRERLIYDNDVAYRNDVLIRTIRQNYQDGLNELEELTGAQVSYLYAVAEHILDKLLEIKN